MGKSPKQRQAVLQILWWAKCFSSISVYMRNFILSSIVFCIDKHHFILLTQLSSCQLRRQGVCSMQSHTFADEGSIGGAFHSSMSSLTLQEFLFRHHYDGKCFDASRRSVSSELSRIIHLRSTSSHTFISIELAWQKLFVNHALVCYINFLTCTQWKRANNLNIYTSTIVFSAMQNSTDK